MRDSVVGLSWYVTRYAHYSDGKFMLVFPSLTKEACSNNW
jgi:hypothetical protein